MLALSPIEKSIWRLVCFSIILFAIVNPSYASIYVIPSDGNIVGEIEYTHPNASETLREVGLRYDIGLEEMILANPNVDPTLFLSPQVRLRIPSQYRLPNVPRHGLVINLAEYRLYFFPEHDNIVMTYPIGIGRRGWSTPIGLTKIVAKEAHPTWHPSKKLIDEGKKHGVMIPSSFPPGPHNPLGDFVLRLGWPTYLIHGSNQMNGIGEKVSAGCIRMLPDDIEYLFKQVSIDTPVRVINEPVNHPALKQLSVRKNDISHEQLKW